LSEYFSGRQSGQNNNWVFVPERAGWKFNHQASNGGFQPFRIFDKKRHAGWPIMNAPGIGQDRIVMGQAS